MTSALPLKPSGLFGRLAICWLAGNSNTSVMGAAAAVVEPADPLARPGLGVVAIGCDALTRDADDDDHADKAGGRGVEPGAESDGNAVSEDRSSFSLGCCFGFAGAGVAGECWPMGTGISPAMMGSANAALSKTTGSCALGTMASSSCSTTTTCSSSLTIVLSEGAAASNDDALLLLLLAWACKRASLADGGKASRAAGAGAGACCCWSVDSIVSCNKEREVTRRKERLPQICF